MGQKLNSKLFSFLNQILQIYISQCSVATQLRCVGGLYLVTCLLQIFYRMCRRKSENRRYHWRRYGQKFVAYFLILGHPV